MKKILFTGFEPFDGAATNPSWDAVSLLPEEIGGCRISRILLPVEYDSVGGLLDAAITMIRKMHKKNLPRTIMVCSCIVMFCINLFAWNFSSISLMLISAVVSLTMFILNGAPEQKGGAKK